MEKLNSVQLPSGSSRTGGLNRRDSPSSSTLVSDGLSEKYARRPARWRRRYPRLTIRVSVDRAAWAEMSNRSSTSMMVLVATAWSGWRCSRWWPRNVNSSVWGRSPSAAYCRGGMTRGDCI